MNFKKIKTDFYISIAKVIAKMPLPMVLGVGRFVGYITWLVPNKRKKIVGRNIALCFPELSLKEQKKLVKQNLISTGMSFTETMMTYWGGFKKIETRFEIEGLEHFTEALKDNKGCILLTCHLHSMELASRVINAKIKEPAYILGRQHNNKIFDAHIDAGRRSHCEKTIDKKDIRTVLKTLKKNRSIFYAPDQNFSYQCKYIPFFKQPAATVIAPVRLAQSTKAVVVPWFCFREKNAQGKRIWKIKFLKPLDYFHHDDTTKSLELMNQLFEKQIRQHPEQYLWVHRRFKNHPKGRNYLYQDI